MLEKFESFQELESANLFPSRGSTRYARTNYDAESQEKFYGSIVQNEQKEFLKCDPLINGIPLSELQKDNANRINSHQKKREQ